MRQRLFSHRVGKQTVVADALKPTRQGMKQKAAQEFIGGDGLEAVGIDRADLDTRADAFRKEGQTVMLVAIDGKAAGLLCVADPIKASASEALMALRKAGIHVAMLTGDSRATAEAVARQLGIDEVHAEVLPDQKASIVMELQAGGTQGRDGWRWSE